MMFYEEWRIQKEQKQPAMTITINKEGLCSTMRHDMQGIVRDSMIYHPNLAAARAYCKLKGMRIKVESN